MAKVTKLRPNELRGANIDDMKLRAAESKLHPVQFFAGKTKEIQTKHYTASAGEGLALLQPTFLVSAENSGTRVETQNARTHSVTTVLF